MRVKIRQLIQKVNLKDFLRPKKLSFLLVDLIILILLFFSTTLTLALTVKPGLRSLPIISNFASLLTPEEEVMIESGEISYEIGKERPLDLPSKFLELIKKDTLPTTPTPQPTQPLTHHLAPTPTPKTVGQPPIPTPTITPSPQPTTGSVEVYFIDDNGQPIPNHYIELYSQVSGSNYTHYKTYRTYDDGKAKIDNLNPGSYKVEGYHDSKRGEHIFSIEAGKTTKVTLTANIAIPTATPVPDTTPPTLDGINGPFDWGDQGICFTINGDQVHDNSSARPFSFAWKLDSNPWSAFVENEAIKCYQGLSSGHHEVWAKVRDPAGNESNIIHLSIYL